MLGSSRARRWATRAVVFIAFLVLVPFLVLLTIIVGTQFSQPTLPTVNIGTAGGIPAVYAPMYDAAGAAYHVDPFVLAALHKTESDYSQDAAAFSPNSAGAVGPMQFLPSTWAAYENAYKSIAQDRPRTYPHKCSTHGCITDDFDSIAAAADYLHQLGADSDLNEATLHALVDYKGKPPASIPYARQAFALAGELQAENMASGGSAISAPSGSLPTKLIVVASSIAAARIPYCYGGGHVTPAKPTHGQYCHNERNEFVSGDAYEGLDCSSSVSMLLQRVGIETPTLTAVQFESVGESGPGRWMTIWANEAHVFVTMGGRSWGTNDGNPYGGPGWAYQSTIGYVPRHLHGL